MSEQMDATKDTSGEPTSPNAIQSVAEFVKKNIGPLKNNTVWKGYSLHFN